MIIILEGCSKTGKTTLAKHIETLGFKYIKCSAPKKCGPYNEYTNILKKIDGDTVIDRFHIGELVFGPLYRKKSDLSDEQFKEIEKQLREKNAILVYCYDNENNIAKRFISEDERFEKTNLIKKQLELYKDAIKRSDLPVYRHKMKGVMDLLKNKEIDSIIKKYKFIGK